MRAEDLIPGQIYRMDDGELAEFSRIGGTWAIFHPPGEPDMQSSFAIEPAKVERQATFEEAQRCRRGEKR